VDTCNDNGVDNESDRGRRWIRRSFGGIGRLRPTVAVETVAVDDVELEVDTLMTLDDDMDDNDGDG
jgi:hypothetical protein